MKRKTNRHCEWSEAILHYGKIAASPYGFTYTPRNDKYLVILNSIQDPVAWIPVGIYPGQSTGTGMTKKGMTKVERDGEKKSVLIRVFDVDGFGELFGCNTSATRFGGSE